METCAFDTLLSTNVPHILEKIFLSLDCKSYKACMQVNSTWRRILTSKPLSKKAKAKASMERIVSYLLRIRTYAQNTLLWPRDPSGAKSEARELREITLRCFEQGVSLDQLRRTVKGLKSLNGDTFQANFDLLEDLGLNAKIIISLASSR